MIRQACGDFPSCLGLRFVKVFKKMSNTVYVRIKVAGFKGKEYMRKDMDKLQNSTKSLFPEIHLFTEMEAPKTTFVETAFYEDKEAADRAFKKHYKQIAQ